MGGAFDGKEQDATRGIYALAGTVHESLLWLCTVGDAWVDKNLQTPYSTCTCTITYCTYCSCTYSCNVPVQLHIVVVRTVAMYRYNYTVVVRTVAMYRYNYIL